MLTIIVKHIFFKHIASQCCLFSASRRNLARVSLSPAGAMLVSQHRFRIPNLELTWMGTSSSGQNKSFRSFGTQYGRCETKANVTYCYLRYLLCSIYSTGNHRSRIYIFSNTLNLMGFDLKKILWIHVPFLGLTPKCTLNLWSYISPALTGIMKPELIIHFDSHCIFLTLLWNVEFTVDREPAKLSYKDRRLL